MKILRLRFTNLNSLREEWTIDFTAPPLAGAGLFAITGPTGAGKSTLLDAITLALYGRAARYGSQANPETVMSRHTGECSAEVEFSCASGTYRSVWQLQRARKKIGGKVQPASRKVIALPSEEVLTQHVGASDAKIAELTGLDYERFLRSVLLAQGEFAAFLKSNAKERTELLQQVTGTGIYQEISKAAHKRCEAARKAHESLIERNKNLPLLDPEKRTQLESQRDEHQQRLAAIAPALKAFTVRLQQAQRRQEHDAARRQLILDETAFAQQSEAAAPQLQRLALHERAIVFAPDLAVWAQQRKDQTTDNDLLAEVEKRLPALVADRTAAEQAHAKAKEAHAALLQRLEADSKRWNEIDALDNELTGLRKSHAEIAEEQGRVAKDQARHAKAKKDASDDRAKIEAALQEAARWIEQHQADGKIAERLAEIQAALTRWTELSKQHNEATQAAKSLEKETEKLSASARAAQTKLSPLDAAFQKADEAARKAAETLAKLQASEPLSEIEKRLGVAQQSREQITQLVEKAIALRQLSARQSAQTKELETLAGKLTESAGHILADRKQCADLTQLLEARQTALNFAERYQSLAGHRATLVSGEPCPLCGALDHPSAEPGGALAVEVATARKDYEASAAASKQAQASLGQAEKLEAGLQAESKRIALELDRDRAAYHEQSAAWIAAARKYLVEQSPEEEPALNELQASKRAEEDRLKELVTSVRAAVEAERKASETATATRHALDQQRQAAAHEQALAQDSAMRLGVSENALRTAAAHVAEAQTAFVQAVDEFGDAVTDLSGADQVLKDLKSRSEGFVKRQKQWQDLNAASGEKRARIEALEQEETHLRTTVDAVQGRVEKALQALNAQQAVRREKFGDRSVAEARSAAEIERKQLDAGVAKTRQTFESGHQQHAQAIQRQTELSATLTRRASEMKSKETGLVARASAAGFEGILLLQEALLSAEEAARHVAVRRQLDERRSDLKHRTTHLDTQRAQFTETAEADAARLPEVQQEARQLETEQTQLNQSLGQVTGALLSDDRLRTQQAGLVAEIDAAHREFARWDRLRAMIGSADGSVFARFAQGLTLERLVILANVHLDQLNPRYRIRRSTSGVAEDLELEIVDRYQADVTRPMRSLSGGESFLVSLALALGLSELASGATTIESLFIDEGFGTLDADTLETAMAALENLQAHGKTIGVISHVAAMQERITTRIQVEKRSGGCSGIVIE